MSRVRRPDRYRLVVRDRRDERIHGARDVGRLLELPVLLSLPRRAFGRPPRLAAPGSATGQRFAELAGALTASLGQGSQTVLVARSEPGAGGSVVAANLAATLARAGREVVLVCVNSGAAVAPGMLGVADGRGLAEVLAGRATVREVARGQADVPGLWVITPGADPSVPVRRLLPGMAQALLAQLRRDARYVIIDGQAPQGGDDAFALAAFADAAVMTVEVARTTRTAADECISRIRQLRTPVLGAAVLTAISPQLAARPARQG